MLFVYLLLLLRKYIAYNIINIIYTYYYNNSQILVLDEATSALDNQTEKKLMKSIMNNYPNLTYIIIAHRLSTVSQCDQIIRIKNGKINQIGKPDEIIPNLNK